MGKLTGRTVETMFELVNSFYDFYVPCKYGAFQSDIFLWANVPLNPPHGFARFEHHHFWKAEMEVLGDDWNILELHRTTCKFLLVFRIFLPRAVFAKGLQSSRSFIGNSSTCFQLPQNSDLFVTSRVKAYSVRKQMHCSQRSSSCMEPCAPPAFAFFFFWKWGLYTQNLQNCTFFNCILNDAIERASWFCSTCILSRSPEARVGMGRSSMVYQWAH